MSFLLHWPLWASALLVYALFVGVALALATLVSGWVGRHATREAAVGGLVPPVGAAMTAGFLVWLALLANIELRDIDDAERAVQAEAGALRSLGVLGSAAAPAAKAGWHAQLADYAQYTLDHEWQGDARDSEGASGRSRVDHLKVDIFSRFAAEPSELRAALLQSVQWLADARQARLTVATGHIPTVIWYALVVCAGIVLLFAALIHARNARAGRWICTLLALMIAVQVHAVYVIDRPFVGVVAVSDAPLRDALQQLQALGTRP